MKLIDKDLMSMQEVRELVESAKEAQRELARMDQAQVDRIVKSIADAGVRNAKRLAQMAQEDTGFGVVSDKVVKRKIILRYDQVFHFDILRILVLYVPIQPSANKFAVICLCTLLLY